MIPPRLRTAKEKGLRPNLDDLGSDCVIGLEQLHNSRLHDLDTGANPDLWVSIGSELDS